MKSKGYLMTNSARIRFKQWLISKDMSMGDFASIIGVSKSYVSMIINGKKHVTPKIRILFAKGGYKII